MYVERRQRERTEKRWLEVIRKYIKSVYEKDSKVRKIRIEQINEILETFLIAHLCVTRPKIPRFNILPLHSPVST